MTGSLSLTTDMPARRAMHHVAASRHDPAQAHSAALIAGSAGAPS